VVREDGALGQGGPARGARTGEVKFVPERFTKTYTNWMENVHDWCISRQLWWGHQIPAWYCDECGHINVSRTDPTKCEKCGCTHLTRDPDVLDTWFSSALWPFSTLGWPEQTEDLKFYYPTSVMVTGYDIIFFWVARMIFSGCEQMGQIPFHTVLIHGLVRDDKGRKMSKSLGNGIDPLEMADKYGADALRFNLITGNSPGNDTRFYTEKCEAMRNFANKIWNASRFLHDEPDHRPLRPAGGRGAGAGGQVGAVPPQRPGAGGHRQPGELRDRRSLRQGL
jgi:valyl-tRNA synthetase